MLYTQDLDLKVIEQKLIKARNANNIMEVQIWSDIIKQLKNIRRPLPKKVKGIDR